MDRHREGGGGGGGVLFQCFQEFYINKYQNFS